MFRRLSFAFFFAACLGAGALEAAIAVKNDYRSPRNKERPFRKSTRLIVLHTTEAHAKSSLNKLSERGEAHYCVTEDGSVYRIVDRDREAFHAGRSMWQGKEDCDTYSVGIEVVGYHDKTMPLKQLEALKELIAQLKKIYKLQDHQVVCHSHVAYGAPNTWHKKKHRGRKRCGMLFAMASVRAQLGLKSRPAIDADVKAKRLVQADDYLQGVLYGNTDTMVKFYEAKTPPKRQSRMFAKSTPAPKPKPAPKPLPKNVADAKPAPKPAPKTVADAKPAPIIKPGGDRVRDLQLLENLPGYVRGGPVAATATPYKIAGAAWKSAQTYYYYKGKITSGDKVDEKSIKPGTLIFYRKRD